MPQPQPLIQGLGTVIYAVGDLPRAKAWYAAAFGQNPYFDEAFYVGFNIAGYELGLDPNGTAGTGGSVGYWRVPGGDAAGPHFVSLWAPGVGPGVGVGGGGKGGARGGAVGGGGGGGLK